MFRTQKVSTKSQQLFCEPVAVGQLLPGEGKALSRIVETRRKALETHELEQRITALEDKKNEVLTI